MEQSAAIFSSILSLILCRDKFVPVKIICVRFHQPPPAQRVLAGQPGQVRTPARRSEQAQILAMMAVRTLLEVFIIAPGPWQI